MIHMEILKPQQRKASRVNDVIFILTDEFNKLNLGISHALEKEEMLRW